MWDIDSIKEVLLDALEVCSLRNGCGLTLKYWVWRDNESTMWKIMVMAWKVSKYVPVGSYWVNEDVQSTVPFPASLAGLQLRTSVGPRRLLLLHYKLIEAIITIYCAGENGGGLGWGLDCI